MKVDAFLAGMEQLGIDFFTGVPDSKLSPLCDALFARHGAQGRHMVAANEGGAVGLAAGHYIATGRPGLVYLQNSGIGNIVNPVASLLSGKVYGIPCVFLVGWRGEPDLSDEPQHAFQGEMTLELLELLQIKPFVLTGQTDAGAFAGMLAQAAARVEAGELSAFVVREGAFLAEPRPPYPGKGVMKRERALEILLTNAPEEAVFVSTTGKTSREVYELREKHHRSHAHDFLTVGSMGHANMIALGIAMGQPNRRVYCLDGDGALLMHMGSLAVEAVCGQRNLVHVLLNNGAHESVGGMPAALGKPSYADIARASGYGLCLRARDEAELLALMPELSERAGNTPCFLEIELAQGSRADLGRPRVTPRENLRGLMESLKGAGE
jgi:phosphonopyruvate decarboxylase